MIILYTRLSFAGPSQPSKSDEDYPATQLHGFAITQPSAASAIAGKIKVAYMTNCIAAFPIIGFPADEGRISWQSAVCYTRNLNAGIETYSDLLNRYPKRQALPYNTSLTAQTATDR
jgi:hypothetical protein